MLLELRVDNYAVMDHAVAQFGPGLNLLTGETGAGKSLLIDALALLMGGKASSEVVRQGADRAVISCVFESTPGAAAVLEESGIDAQGGEVLLRREIGSAGKGRVFVDGQATTVAVLRRLAPELALVHQQSETLGDFDAAQQRILLDRFGGLSQGRVADAFVQWQQASARLAELESGEQDRLRNVDLWSFQAREIASADPGRGEDAALEAEKRVLANAERVRTAAEAAHSLLYEAETSALSLLSSALRHVEELARFDPKWSERAEQLQGGIAVIGDVSDELRGYAQTLEASPERLAEIEDRLALLDRLKRKYAAPGAGEGSQLDQVIAFGEQVRARLEEVENLDAVLKEAREQMHAAAKAFAGEAAALSAQRDVAARRLEKLTSKHIAELAMKARFAIAVERDEDSRAWSAHGWDTISCRIATAAGEPLRPLGDIASGGEMSRVLLALKVSVEEGAAGKSRRTALPRTLVFDEIDIGIGGRAAEAVGRMLQRLARGQQVLCVTHLPQIAAFATQHLSVEKSEARGRTVTRVRSLSPDESLSEVARMLSGATVTAASRRHAEEMIAASRDAEQPAAE